MTANDHLSAHLARVAASPLPSGTKESAYNLPETTMEQTTTVYGMTDRRSTTDTFPANPYRKEEGK